MIKRLFVFIPVLLAVLAFEKREQGNDNTLSRKEKKEGWVLLFDGTTLQGWRPYKNIDADNWGVANGEIFCKKEGSKRRADLVTAEQYEDFELSIDWKVGAGLNSGIIYRCTEENGASFESGPEYQLIDDTGYPGKLTDKQLSGANYDMDAPSAKVFTGANQFNHTRIVVKGAHVEHWLNGTKIVEYELWSPEWVAHKAASKWRDVKPYGMAKKGHIALQDHGGGIWFKNIKLRKL